MKPINHKDIATSRAKFLLFVLLPLGVIPAVVFAFWQLPLPTLSPTPNTTPVAQDTFDLSRVQAVEGQLEDAALRLKNVNLFLLLDATPGMEEQLPAIATTAEKLISTTQAKVSAACYRDAVEGAWLYMQAPEGDDVPQWIRRLSTDVQYDQDAAEAVYYGIQQALRSSTFQEGETNVLLLLGDAGNHAQEDITQVNPDVLRASLSEKNVHFLAVQVRHPGGPAYEQFGHQLLEDFLMPQVDNIDQIQDSTLTYGLQYRTMSRPAYQLVTCHAQTAVPPADLSDLLSTYIADLQNEIDNQLHSLEVARTKPNSIDSPLLQRVDPVELAYWQAYHRSQAPSVASPGEQASVRVE